MFLIISTDVIDDDLSMFGVLITKKKKKKKKEHISFIKERCKSDINFAEMRFA